MQPNPVQYTGAQVNEACLNLAAAIIGKAAELLQQPTFSPERLGALAAMLEACANNFEDGE